MVISSSIADEGYVDINDLLASDDLSLEIAMVHFLTERNATANYAQRIAPEATCLMQNFRSGITWDWLREHRYSVIFLVILVLFLITQGLNRYPVHTRNSRGDRIIVRHDTRGWSDIYTAHVVTHNGRALTAQDYKELLEQERVTEQIKSERMR